MTDGASPATSPVSTDNPATYNKTRASRVTSGTPSSRGRKCDERIEAPARERDPERASSKREKHAFDQQLTDERTARSAERRANGDFLPARGRSRNQQVRDIEACDREQYANGDVEQDE